MTAIELTYLNAAGIERLALSDEEILQSIRALLVAQGRGETVIEPRVHLFPRSGREADGHFNVLRGAAAQLAGVKVVGDFVGNHHLALPSELALLLLMDPDTGVPVAILDATAITEMRTGAVTAIGAEHLARKDSRSDSGRLSPANLYAELGEIVCGQRRGREHDSETILFWHRGLSITDIALGQTMLAKARALGVGIRLPYGPHE